jgi:hypothetical protein
MNYQYPDNLRAKPTLWLWELKHVTVLGVVLLLSVLAFSQLHTPVLLAITAVGAFLTIRMDDTTILDYIRNCIRFFITKQQIYFWR